ncbi:mechanosensitive ion channel family protein [Desulfococcus sp.]|uniref:mechanosensitive ion channel family protein n=1 Tax=Desulfococcus sp. TaxID=2025834 RepID=UPI003D121DC4
MSRKSFGLIVLILMTAAMSITAPAALSKEPASVPTTTVNIKISVPDLKILLTPLTQSELAVEVDAWQRLVKDKVTEISRLQIQSKTVEGEEKQKILDQLTRLREERTALIDRFNAVLRELNAKGGDVATYEKYVKAVSGIDISSDDALSSWSAVRGWLTSKEGGIRWIFNIVKFILILLAFMIIANIVGAMARKSLTRASLSALLKDFIVNTTQKVVFILGLIIALSMLEVNIGPLLAGLGVIGFVVGFALQNTLSNFAAGFMILLYRPYDIGNFVTAGGVTGTVDSMNLVSTTIKTPDNQSLIVPNGQIWGDVITNVTGNATRRVDLVFGIGYDDDIAKAQKVLEDIVDGHNLVLKNPAYVIKVHELADSSVNFICRPWVRTGDYWTVYWDITRAVKERFDAEGIGIPYPQRDVHVYQMTE